MSEAFTRQVVAFGRVLREAGLEVGPGRIADALRGLESIDLARQEDFYWALQSTLVSRREELEPFNRAFDAWFLRRAVRPPDRSREDPRQARKGLQRLRRDAQPASAEQASAGEPESIGHSPHEVLREKDFAAMTPEEFAAARALISAIAGDRPLRRSRRSRTSRRGSALDMRGLARASIATGGEPIERRFRQRTQKPRKLVILCDVSGSMEAYTRALLLYLHASVRSGDDVEVFAFGTRLTRLTSELESRDPDVALARAAQRVVDWASGTRIGASLKTYNDVWGRWALTRGAVVVIFSDGWDRGDHAQVGEQMARLHRAAFAVVWVNPLLGSSDYQPLGGGMRAALPFVDRFVSGHNLASLQALSGLLAGIAHRHLL